MAVYFIRAGEHGPVKIGHGNPEKRLCTLQIGTAETLRIVRAVPGGLAEEREFHRRYQDRRIKGEWFTWSDDMLTATVEVPSPRTTAVHEIVERFGGEESMRSAVDERSPSVIRGWLRMGRIPHFRRHQILAGVRAAGMIVPDELLGRLFAIPAELRSAA